jgi:hypothetical protein
MCHSLESYMPELARRAAEERLGVTAQAPRTPVAGPALARLAASLRRLATRTVAPGHALPRRPEEAR